MIKVIVKIAVFVASILFLTTCDKYEFPKSPYPRLETLPVVNISKTGATFQANVIQNTEQPIIDHGFVWSTVPDPWVSGDEKVQLGAASNLQNFVADVKSDFNDGNTYYVKAFVATADYLVYGEAVSFTSME